MTYNPIFREQVALLVSLIPTVAKENCFALKGGTAINLFIRDLPRLSVDIDLTYLPISDRTQSLRDIDDALKRIAERIRKIYPKHTVYESAPSTQKTINKLVIRSPHRLQIKIEVTPVLRGCVYEPVILPVSQRKEDEFGFAKMKVLSFADLYAGKIMAALDRQHPRDLFNIHYLLENEGITDELRTALLIYLISHDHSPYSLLSPQLKDISAIYETDFVGMVDEDFSYEALTSARLRLIDEVVTGMPDIHKELLISFYKGNPKWDLIKIPGVEALPAVRWREINLDKAGQETRLEIIKKLEGILN